MGSTAVGEAGTIGVSSVTISLFAFHEALRWNGRCREEVMSSVAPKPVIAYRVVDVPCRLLMGACGLAEQVSVLANCAERDELSLTCGASNMAAVRSKQEYFQEKGGCQMKVSGPR
jgi:hypothetical protein